MEESSVHQPYSVWFTENGRRGLSRYAELIAYFPISKLPQGLSFPASGCLINFAWVLMLVPKVLKLSIAVNNDGLTLTGFVEIATSASVGTGLKLHFSMVGN